MPGAWFLLDRAYGDASAAPGTFFFYDKKCRVDRSTRFSAYSGSIPAPRKVLCSAILNGGLAKVYQVFNLGVAQNFHGQRTHSDTPPRMLLAYANRLHPQVLSVGMMPPPEALLPDVAKRL